MKHFMEIAGRRMAYLDEGQGPVLLFGHSYLWDSAMWAPQIEALKGSYRCIVPELWGHGDSDLLPEGGCTTATLARDHWRCSMPSGLTGSCWWASPSAACGVLSWRAWCQTALRVWC